MAIDWRTVTAWRDLLLSDDLPRLIRAIEARGPRRLLFAWDPPISALDAPQNRFLMEHWRSHAAAGLPPVAIADPSLMRPALGYIVLAEPTGDDITYRLFGSTLVSVSGFDMTRKRLSEHPAGPPIIEAGLAAYLAVRRRALPLLWRSEPEQAAYTASWERLILPLAGPDGTVARFIAGNVPFDSGGSVLAM